MRNLLPASVVAPGMSNPLPVHVWSDIACPWCFIGKRRFAKGAEMFGGEVSVEYHSFELAPDTPVDFEGSEVDFLARHKGMAPEKVEEMLAQMTQLAAVEGLTYDFDRVQHTKTLLAHQALHFAKGKGKQLELVERLFSAYFEEGRHVGRVEDLVELGTEVGLEAGELRAALEAGDYAQHVAADIDAAQQIGITGVPFYVIDGKYAVSGAQPAELFASALQRAAEERATHVEGIVADAERAGERA